MKKSLLRIITLTVCMVLLLSPVQGSANSSRNDASDIRAGQSAAKTTEFEVRKDTLKNNVIIVNDSIDRKNTFHRSDVSNDLFDAETYASIKAAGAYLRSQMKQRESVISVAVDSSGDYKDIYMALINEAETHTGVPTEGDYIGRQWNECSITTSMYGTVKEYEFTFDYFTTAEQEREMDKAVESLLGELAVYGESDYAKVKAVYDWICANVVYDYGALETDDPLAHSAYAALIKRTSVCQGYAVLFYRLMLELGVDNRCVSSENHEWNIVKLFGLYYNVDSTWDAGMMGSYRYFLKNMQNFEDDPDHMRSPEFETREFYRQYPMSAADFDPSADHTKSQVPGDVNNDYVLDSADVVLILRYLAGWDVELH